MLQLGQRQAATLHGQRLQTLHPPEMFCQTNFAGAKRPRADQAAPKKKRSYFWFCSLAVASTGSQTATYLGSPLPYIRAVNESVAQAYFFRPQGSARHSAAKWPNPASRLLELDAELPYCCSRPWEVRAVLTPPD